MIFIIIYVIVLVCIYIKVLDLKEAFQRSLIAGVLCFFCWAIINFCFEHMEGIRDLFIDTKVYEIAGVNSDTIVYIDENNNLAVIDKNNVVVIKNDHTIKSWLTCIELKTAGKALSVKSFPEDWEAYVVPKDNLE